MFQQENKNLLMDYWWYGSTGIIIKAAKNCVNRNCWIKQKIIVSKDFDHTLKIFENMDTTYSVLDK